MLSGGSVSSDKTGDRGATNTFILYGIQVQRHRHRHRQKVASS